MIPAFDLTVKVPSKYETLGVGTKVEERVEGDVSITRWTSEFPVSFPTIIFGDYVTAEASIEAKKSDGTKIPVVIHADRHGMSSWDIRPKQLGPLADMAVNSINLYEKVFGVDYPFDKLDLVNDPMGMFQGQSPASIVYLGGGVFRGSGTVGVGSGSDLTRFNDTVVAHEVGHQWWGGLINNANRRSYWFIETLAEYSSAVYVEAVEGRKDPEKGWKAYLDHVDAWRHEVLDAGLHGSVEAADSLNVGGRRAAIYFKGPYAFHMMRMIFGTEKMDQFLLALGTELAGQQIVTRDIQKVAEKAFGGDMEWFFNQWIRGVGLPEFSVVYTTRRTEDGNYLISGKVKQRVVVGKEKTPVPDVFYRHVGHITVTDRKGTEYPPVRFIVEGEETPFQFKVPKEPYEVAFNKYGEILAHDVLVNRDF
jgi:aminopeptidase N